MSDDRTIDLLRSNGVQWGQGFHLGRPGPLEGLGLEPTPLVVPG